MATRLPIEDVASTARATVAALHAVLLVEEPHATAELLLDLERVAMTAEDLRARATETHERNTDAYRIVGQVKREINSNMTNDSVWTNRDMLGDVEELLMPYARRNAYIESLFDGCPTQ